MRFHDEVSWWGFINQSTIVVLWFSHRIPTHGSIINHVIQKVPSVDAALNLFPVEEPAGDPLTSKPEISAVHCM